MLQKIPPFSQQILLGYNQACLGSATISSHCKLFTTSRRRPLFSWREGLHVIFKKILLQFINCAFGESSAISLIKKNSSSINMNVFAVLRKLENEVLFISNNAVIKSLNCFWQLKIPSSMFLFSRFQFSWTEEHIYFPLCFTPVQNIPSYVNWQWSENWMALFFLNFADILIHNHLIPLFCVCSL